MVLSEYGEFISKFNVLGLKKIQNVFLNCYFNSSNTNNLFEELTLNKNIDFY